MLKTAFKETVYIDRLQAMSMSRLELQHKMASADEVKQDAFNEGIILVYDRENKREKPMKQKHRRKYMTRYNKWPWN